MKKILVIEDNYEVRENTAEIIALSDFEVITAENGQVGVELAIKELPDLIVCDIMMPVLDGYGAYYLLSKYNETATIPFIFLTAKSEKADFRKAMEMGVEDYITKPFDESELLNAIEVRLKKAELNKRLTNFAYTVTHNLRSHVNNISMLLNFYESEVDEKEQFMLFSMLKTATEKLNETVANLNEAVLINTSINQKKTAANLHEVIVDAKSNIVASLKSRDVSFNNKVDPKVVIHAVPAYLESIILNFLTNAIKYSSPDRKPEINIYTEKQKNYIILKIQDNGLGIDLDKYGGELFGRYKTFHGNGDATGIGLFLAKSQIEAMNGKVEVESEVGKGTTFSIYFNEED